MISFIDCVLWGQEQRLSGSLLPFLKIITSKSWYIVVLKIQAYLGDTMGLVPDHRHKANNTTKLVTIFLLVEDLAVNLKKIYESQ